MHVVSWTKLNDADTVHLEFICETIKLKIELADSIQGKSLISLLAISVLQTRTSTHTHTHTQTEEWIGSGMTGRRPSAPRCRLSSSTARLSANIYVYIILSSPNMSKNWFAWMRFCGVFKPPNSIQSLISMCIRSANHQSSPLPLLICCEKTTRLGNHVTYGRTIHLMQWNSAALVFL